MSNFFSSLLKETEVNQTTSGKVGEFGEKTAAEYLKRRGFRLVASNFKAPIGRNSRGTQVSGEIDLIAFDNDKLCFIEVKTRSSDDFASPLTAVDIRKQRQITRTARVYRKIFEVTNLKFRYDVVSIILNNKKAPKIELIKGFWNENKFKKRLWADDLF